MGRRILAFKVENRSNSPCGLTNQVSLSGVDAAGVITVLPITSATQNPDPLVLQPRGQASTALTDPQSCEGGLRGHIYTHVVVQIKGGLSYPVLPASTQIANCGKAVLLGWIAGALPGL